MHYGINVMLALLQQEHRKVTARTAADAVTGSLIAQEQVRAYTIRLHYTQLLAYHANNTLSCIARAQ
jgi:hypothetical protein